MADVSEATGPCMEFSAVVTHGIAPVKRAYHSCSAVENSLFVFGGIGEDKAVLNDIYRYDIETVTWSQVDDRHRSSSLPQVSSCFPKEGMLCTAPCLSHHTATVIRDRYIIIIGGWNGKKRVAEVFCFDTANSTWRHIPESGDVPVGLSSHTACLISTKDILIVGREGGVHTQRRFSGAFYLDIETGKYTEAPFQTASRSGHTANLINVRASKDYYLFVFGGRKSGGYELLSRWHHRETTTQSYIPQSKIEKLLASCSKCDEPEGRQHSWCVELSDRYLMFYGGEKWSGVRENVTNETYILDTHKMTWYSVPVSDHIPKLVGHTMCVVTNKVLVFGGTLHNKPCDTMWQVDFPE